MPKWKDPKIFNDETQVKAYAGRVGAKKILNQNGHRGLD